MEIEKLEKKLEAIRIPKITKAELARRIRLARPCIIKEEADKLTTIHVMKDPHPSNVSFIWDPKGKKEIGIITPGGISVRNKKLLSGGCELKPVGKFLGEFVTLHGCGHPALFKPSVEEILSQLPKMMFSERNLSGRTLYYTTNILNDDNVYHTSMLGSIHHIAKTRVYISIDKRIPTRMSKYLLK